MALRDEEHGALARLNSLQHAEAEQVLRLETLQAEEQNRRSQIVELEQRRATIGEEIRLDLLGTSENGQAGTATQEGDLHAPAHEASLQEQGSSQVEQLVEEEERLRALVADLILQAGRLDDDRQSQVASMAAVETQHRAAVKELVAKESALRNKIQQLEAILEQLQARLNEAAASEKGPSEEECVLVDGGVQQPSSPFGTDTDVPDIARRDDGNEIEESLAVSEQHNRLALEHMVQALHSDDEVSIVSAATETLGVRRPGAASSFVSEQPADESEVT